MTRALRVLFGVAVALAGCGGGDGGDPRRLDGLRYGQATDEYTEAAVSLDNAARSACS